MYKYSFACDGLKAREQVFSTREDANKYMYKLVKKHGLTRVDIWHDHHDITYVYSNGVKFYIHRL